MRPMTETARTQSSEIASSVPNRNRYRSEVRAYRRRMHLCHDCGEPIVTGRTLCAKHLNAARERSARLRTERIACGACEDCDRTPLPGRTLCKKHIANRNARARKCSGKRRTNRMSAGLCVRCEGELQGGNKSNCGECRRSLTESAVRKRAKYREHALCTKCGEWLAAEGHKWCLSCCTTKREYRGTAKRRQARRRRDQEIRREVIARYGGECACCRLRALEALVIDHINGGGRRDRRLNGNVYRRLHREQRTLRGFRVLCHNCNHSARLHDGECHLHRRRTIRRRRENQAA